MPALPQGLDLDPRQVARIAGERFPTRYRRRLERFRYGPAAFKVDYGPDGPIPWKEQECLQAGTVHVGGTLEEVAASEAGVGRGEHPEKPFVLVAQQSLFDPGRAPRGKHTAWAYCHVPHGSTVDMTERIEAQIERFAPGFRQRVLARRVFTSADLEARTPNCVGGDIAGGANDILELVGGPSLSLIPTPAQGPVRLLGLDPPGAGVHGMCGYWAARFGWRRSFGKRIAL